MLKSESMENEAADILVNSFMKCETILSPHQLKITIPNKPINRDHRSLLETLAELASQKSPMKGESLSFGSNENIGQGRRQRARAMSEPWIFEDSWTRPVIIPGAVAAQALAHTHIPVLAHCVATAPNRTSSSGDILFPTTATVPNNSISSLPQILENVEYNNPPNQNGRIGIYTREERKLLIGRFHDKRKRRVWRKKIRYHCRKNLAESRVRIKGRFVKAVNLSLVEGGVVREQRKGGGGSQRGATDTAPRTDVAYGDDGEGEEYGGNYNEVSHHTDTAGSSSSISITTATESHASSSSSSSSSSSHNRYTPKQFGLPSPVSVVAREAVDSGNHNNNNNNNNNNTIDSSSNIRYNNSKVDNAHSMLGAAARSTSSTTISAEPDTDTGSDDNNILTTNNISNRDKRTTSSDDSKEQYDDQPEEEEEEDEEEPLDDVGDDDSPQSLLFVKRARRHSIAY